MQFRIVCPDQTIKYLKCIAKIIQDDSGASSKMIGTNWDITDQVCQQKEIQKPLSLLHERLINAV